MRKLQLYNSLSNSLEEFVPLDKNNVRMYACGPTVYASPHIGNARPLVIFDVLFRVLKYIYNGRVTYVRNVTDVDDKINARAKALGCSIKDLTNDVTCKLKKNLLALNILEVTHEPRATDHIQDILSIIRTLIDNGFAYKADGHVLFRVKSFDKYGILSKRNLDDMIAGSRVEIAPYKEDPMDFVLWKPSEEGMPAWDSDFGKGRPGWHIECSAMSSKYLGTQFDIHAGGQDLMFPHHENELAQNYGAFGCIMANYWIHNGMLLVDGQKMSKSLGNVISIDDALSEFNGELIRYILLSTHYHKILNWNKQIIHQAQQSLDRLYGALRLATDINSDANCECAAGNCVSKATETVANRVIEVLCKNLNTPLALNCLHDTANKIYKSDDQNEINQLCTLLREEAGLLGLLKNDSAAWFKQTNFEITEKEIEELIHERSTAKSQKNFELADEIRKKLLGKNVQIEDTKEGTKWKFCR